MHRKFRPAMHTVWRTNVSNNPTFAFHVFNDAECRAFIRDEFDARTLAAYDKLRPGAYKADLWRLCVLYKRGGIYMDMKFRCVRPLSELLEHVGYETIFVRDWGQVNEGTISIYQAVLIAKAGDSILARAIETLVGNVEAEYYGASPLDPTGPVMLGRCIPPEESFRIRLAMQPGSDESVTTIVSDGITWIRQYTQYRQDQNRDMVRAAKEYYVLMWNTRSIYGPRS